MSPAPRPDDDGRVEDDRAEVGRAGVRTGREVVQERQDHLGSSGGIRAKYKEGIIANVFLKIKVSNHWNIIPPRGKEYS